MRYEPLHVGDLVYYKGLETKLGIVLGIYEHNVFHVYWFDTLTKTLLPMGVLNKIRRIT